MSRRYIEWILSTERQWLDFLNVDLSELNRRGDKGVYVIFSVMQDEPQAIRLGQGIIAERIAEHQENDAITGFGELRVTWAVDLEKFLDGIESYLADTLNPIIGERFPDVPHIEVNLPW